jgi:predicted metal-dependent hydrolase
MRSRKHYLQNKKVAREIIMESLDFFARLYGVKYKKVAIRNQKTKWGSCSKSGNLNFNYKIAFLPKDQRDYVVIHEICHLIEFNHSKRFWNEVGRTIPNYKEIRKKVKSNSLR